MSYERIDSSAKFDPVRSSHEIRYRLAKGFVEDGDTVLDAGCGTGYGKKILKATKYIGLDKNPPKGFIKWDFDEQPIPDYEFDVFVGLEIIEHLRNPHNLIQLAKRARKWIILSTPVIPTSHRNEFHFQDFTTRQVARLFVDDDWETYNIFKQSGVNGIFVFGRK